MGVNFLPTRGDFTEMRPFRYWCQKVLPLVYDDSLSYYELLSKVIDALNKSMEDLDTLNNDISGMYNAFSQLQDYVNHYFDTLDIQNQINAKLDYMARTGELSDIVRPFIPNIVTDWLRENVSPTSPVVDKSLTIEGAAADAYAVGVALTEIPPQNIPVETERVTTPPTTYSAIRTPIRGTTTTGYLWNSGTHQGVANASASYTRFDDISEYSVLYFNGYNGSDTYCLASFYNNSNQLVSKVALGVTHSCILGYEVIKPQSSTYVIVNGIDNEPLTVTPECWGLVGNSNTVGYMKKLNGILYTGEAWNCEVDDPQGGTGDDFMYIKYPTIPNASKIYVSGNSYGYGFKLIAFYDSEDTLLSSYVNTGSTYCYNQEINIPPNASYFIVNGNASADFEPVVNYPLAVGEIASARTLENVFNPYYLFVGDSYAEGWSHDGVNGGWVQYLVEYLGLQSGEYASTTHGGDGFGNGGFNNQISDIVNADITDIVVCGGYNDAMYTEAQILNGIRTFVNTAKSIWTGIKIHVGFIANNKMGTGEGAENNWEEIKNNFFNVVMPAYKKCSTLDCDYLVNVETCLNEDGLTPSDGYHPNELGNRQIANGIANALYTGSSAMGFDSRSIVRGLKDEVNDAFVQYEQGRRGVFKDILYGYYYTLDGYVRPYVGWGCVKRFRVNAGERVYYNSPVSSAYNMFYDGSYNKIAGSDFVTNGSGSVVAPEGAVYVGFSNTMEGVEKLDIWMDGMAKIEEDLADVKSALTLAELATVENAKPNVLAESWSQHNISTTTGEVNPITNSRVISTDFYPLSDKTDTTFTGVVRGSGETHDRMRFIFCYDKNGTYLSYVSPGSDIPTNTCFVRFLYGFVSAESTTIADYGLNNLIADWGIDFTTNIDKIEENTQSYNTGRDIIFVDENNNIGAIIRNGFDSDNARKTNAKYISILGDSISTYGASGYKMPEADNFYPRYDVLSLNDMWFMKVAKEVGAEILRSASWAGSHVTGNTADTTGKVGVSDARIDYLGTETADPDIIIVAIGTNDFNSTSGASSLGTFDDTTPIPANEGTITQFAPAYALMLAKIHAKYPLAVVYCCTIMARRSNSSVDEFEYPVVKNGMTIDDYNNAIRSIAKLMNCKVIETTACGMSYWNISTGENGGYSDRVYGDNYIHPAKKGMDYIARTVINEL